MKLEYSFDTTIRVRYGETDQMGYCYYGNYAQYFEVGRVETLRSLGLSYRAMEESGIMLPVSRYEVDFLAAAFYDDLLNISTRIVSLVGSRITFEYQAIRDGIVIATGKTILVFVDKQTKRPIRPPRNFVELMNDFEIK